MSNYVITSTTTIIIIIIIILQYNNYTCQFGRILEQGKYTTDVGVTLISFQRTLQDLKIGSLSCLTGDQVLVQLEVNMQVGSFVAYANMIADTTTL